MVVFYNAMIHQKSPAGIARTGDRPGVTKSNQWISISPYLELLDTPGMLWPRLDDQQAAKRLCYIGSVKDDVTDLYLLSLSLLEEMMETCQGHGSVPCERSVPPGAGTY